MAGDIIIFQFELERQTVKGKVSSYETHINNTLAIEQIRGTKANITTF